MFYPLLTQYRILKYYCCLKEAEKALRAHDKLLRGRNIVVTYASQAPLYDDNGRHGPGGRYRRSEPQRPTALSLMKASGNPSRCVCHFTFFCYIYILGF